MKKLFNILMLCASLLAIAACGEKPGGEIDQPKSDECALISVSAEGQIGETEPPVPQRQSFRITMGYFADITSLKLEMEVSEGATVTPSLDEPQDFSKGPVVYTVTAESELISQDYKVEVVVSELDSDFDVSIEDQPGGGDINL